MTDDPDAMWKPGYEPPDITTDVDDSPPNSDGGTTAEPADRQPPAGRARWFVATAVLAVVAVGVGLAITSRSADAPTDWPDADAVIGADSRRLPTTSSRLWTTTITSRSNETSTLEPAGETTGETAGESAGETAEMVVQPIEPTQYLIDGRSTIAAVLAIGDDESIGVGLDALSGAERWRRAFPFDADAANLLGVLDGTLIIEQNDVTGRRLIGVDIDSGEDVWVRPTRDNGVHVILAGTSVITRVSFTGNERLTFIDPANGEESTRVDGRLIGTDHQGTWYIESGQRIRSIDLDNGVGTLVDIAERTDGWGGPTAVVEGRTIVLADDGSLAAAPDDDGPLVPLTGNGNGTGTGTGNGIDGLPEVIAMVPTGGPTLIATGDGQVAGVTIVGDSAELRWSSPALVRVIGVTARGLLVAVSDATAGFAGGADIAIVDAATGARLAASGPAPSTDSLPAILGDGFVVTNRAQLGLEHIGYDLDGEEVWRLPTSDPLEFGDRIMITVRSTNDGVAVTAFGDPAD